MNSFDGNNVFVFSSFVDAVFIINIVIVYIAGGMVAQWFVLLPQWEKDLYLIPGLVLGPFSVEFVCSPLGWCTEVLLVTLYLPPYTYRGSYRMVWERRKCRKVAFVIYFNITEHKGVFGSENEWIKLDFNLKILAFFDLATPVQWL